MPSRYLASNETSAPRLRREAIPLSWAVLDESQKVAFRKMLRCFHDAAINLDQHERQREGRTSTPLLPISLDANRQSRVLLIDGERGMGKTALLLSLMQATAAPERWKLESASSHEKGARQGSAEPGDTGGDEARLTIPDDKEAYTEIQQLLSDLRGRLVWLDTLDMEPFPRSPNLLAAILARVEEAVGRFVASGDAAEGGGLLAPRWGEDPIQELRRIQNDVALSWDGNLDRRAGAIDPDPFAQEVLRVERSRLVLNDRLRKALDQVARLVSRTREANNPLFVLPVDDFDLNPAHCLELLRLFRMVMVPRLLFVMLGDLKVVTNIVRWNLGHELSEVAGNRDGTAAEKLSQEIERTSGELARHGVRKLLPPGQVIKVRSMTIGEARGYRPDEAQASLEGVLREIKVNFPEGLKDFSEWSGSGADRKQVKDSRLSNLAEFLFPRPAHISAAAEGSSSEGPRTVVYQAARIFYAPPRQVADFWLQFNELREQEAERAKELGRLPIGAPPWLGLNVSTEDAVIDLVAHIFHALLREDSRLQPQEQDKFAHCVRRDPATARWNFYGHGIKVGATERELGAVETGMLEITLLRPEEYKLHIRETVKRSIAGKDRTTHFWPERTLLGRTRAALLLARDLIDALAPERLVTDLLPYDRSRLVKLSWSYLKREKHTLLNWPVSIEHSWSFDRFAQIWGDTVSHLFKVCKRSEADNLDSLAYLWIGLGAAQEFGEPPSEWCQTLTPDPRAWEELATKIAKKNDARKEWIVQLACMLAPENGLRDEPVGHLLGHQGLSTILTRPDVAAEVRAQRLEALEAFAEGEMKEFGMRLIAPNAFIQNLESGTLMRWARLLDWDVQIHVDQSDEEQVLTKDTAVGLSEQARKYLSFGNRVIKAYKEGRLSAEREKLMAEVKAFLPALSRAISSEEVSEDTTDELDLTTSGLLAFVVVAAKPHPLNLLGNGSLCPSWEQVETVEQERDWDRLLSDLEAL